MDMYSVTVSSHVKSGLKANKAGRRDTVAEFSTVPPKSGRLTPMKLYQESALRDLDRTKLATSTHSDVAKAGRFAVGRSSESLLSSVSPATLVGSERGGSSSLETQV